MHLKKLRIAFENLNKLGVQRSSFTNSEAFRKTVTTNNMVIFDQTLYKESISASSKYWVIQRNCTYKVMITPAVYSDFLLQKTGLDWESFEAKATGSGISLASVWLYSLFNPDDDRCNGSEVMCLVHVYHWNVCSGYLMITLVKQVPGSRRDPAKIPGVHWDPAGSCRGGPFSRRDLSREKFPPRILARIPARNLYSPGSRQEKNSSPGSRRESCREAKFW